MSLSTLITGASSMPETSFLQFFTDFIRTPGVLSVIGGDFLVEQQASPNMTVKVAVGRAYVKGATTNAYPVRNDASANVTITANASGNPRKDAIVLFIDTAASPNSGATNVATLICIAGTPGASPIAPTDAEINTALSSKPFIRLANVTVASGAGSIVTANIADARVTIQFKINQTSLKDLVYAADGGSNDTYVITLPVIPSSLVEITGLPIAFKANTINTGAATLNVNSLGAKTIKKAVSSDLVDGDIQAGQVVIVIYDGTNFQLQSLNPLVTLVNTVTLTNKRITKRISTVADSATPTPNADTDDIYTVTALAQAATFGAPTGTPTNGQPLLIRVEDNGTARALGFNAIYRFSTDIPAPTTTVLGKTMYAGFIYNTTDSKWDCVALINGF